MRNEEVFLKIYRSIFVIAPDKGLFDIGVCDIDFASCDGIVRSIDFTIVCSKGDVFL